MVKTVDVDLPVDVFDAQTNIPLIHQVVVAQLAAARQGTHATKTRGEVAGGGKKPYRQKGTGRARQGSIRAPQYAGGGIVHGPQPRDYSQRTNKKMKAAALRGALSDRVRTGRLHVVDALVPGDAPSTKTAVAALRELTARPRVLVVVDREDAITAKSLRNVAGAAILTFDQLNTYDVLLSDDVIFTQAAYDAFVAARSTEGIDTVKLSAAATEVDTKAAPGKKKSTAKPAKADKPAKESATSQPLTAADVVADANDAVESADAGEPYGAGSKGATKSGKAPAGYDIKGNADSMKYHLPDGQWYDATVAEVWFDTEESARKAGFTKAGTDATDKAEAEPDDAKSDDAESDEAVSEGAVSEEAGAVDDTQPARLAASAAESTEADVKEEAKAPDEADTTESDHQPYGPGSKAPTKSGKAPAGYDIKGNADSMKYHLPDGQWYDATVAEVWFDTEEAAQAAGFEKAGK